MRFTPSLETVEDRCLLSASHHHPAPHVPLTPHVQTAHVQAPHAQPHAAMAYHPAARHQPVHRQSTINVQPTQNNLYGYYPAAWDWGSGLTYPMNGNDVLGDCTAAAVNHTIETWRHWAWWNDYCTLDQVKQFYFMTTGGVDSGQYEPIVLQYWANPGMAGNTIYSYVHLNQFNHTALNAAIWDTVGGVEVTLALPYTAVQQFVAGQEWSYVTYTGNGAPYSYGAHEIELTGYNSYNDTYYGVSWGREIAISGQFINMYATDVYAVMGADAIRYNGQVANGQTPQQVAYEMSRIAG